MAKVLNPFMAGEARGSVGSLTASRNRSGAIVRQNASPVQPRTQATQLVRYDVQAVNKAFQNLTAVEISNWNDFAVANPRPDVFGNSIARTGLNWFVALNTRLRTAGLSILTNPPATANPAFNPDMDATFLSGVGVQFSFNPEPFGNERIWLQWSGNVPLSRNFLSRDVRQRQLVSAADSSPLTIIPVADLILDTTQRQITAFAVDDSGRATPKLRFTVRPTSP